MTSSSHIAEATPGAAMDRRIEKPKTRRRRLIAIIGGGVALVSAAVMTVLWLGGGSDAVAVKKANVEIANVQRAPFEDYLPLRATVTPMVTNYVAAVDGGQVAEVFVQDGAEVKAGAPLARLENPQLTLDVTSREAEISGRLGEVSAQDVSLQQARAAREAEVAEANYKLLVARRELEKRERLHNAGFESDAALRPYAEEAAYDAERLKTLQREATDEEALRRTQAAQIQQTAAGLKRNLAIVQASLGALTLRAPAAGRLTNFTLQPGQPVKAGDTLGQVDAEGANKLVAEVDEFYLGRIGPGLTANATFDEKTFPLTVLRVLPQVTGGRFLAELGFQGAPPAGLKHGQSLDLRLTLGSARPALVLPNGPWIEASGGAWAFVLTSSGRAERRAVTIGRRNPEQVEVLRGLKPGDRVVVSSYAGLEPYKRLLLH